MKYLQVPSSSIVQKRSCIERFLLYIALLLLVPALVSSSEKRVFVTATDTEHYNWTLNLISGIHHYHENGIEQIAIFDIGLTSQERKELKKLCYVEVYEVEKVNTQIFEKFTVNSQGKIARGLYSWKPVVLKQASSLFPTFFYLDSGISVVGSLELLYNYLEENGCFLIDCGHNIGRMSTEPVRKLFRLNQKHNAWVLNENGISAGFQGITRAVYSNYIYPIYEMSFAIENFCDDGSCPKGFGFARHDQTLFSIQARLTNLPIHKAVRGQSLNLMIEGKKRKVRLSDFIKITRSEFDLQKARQHLQYKEAH